MCIKGFLRPSRGKIGFFVILVMVLAILSSWAFFQLYVGIFNFWAAIIVLISYPFVLVQGLFIPYSIYPFIAEGIFLYILACIYVTAYNWLDSTLRRKCPQINARWEKGGKHEGKK